MKRLFLFHSILLTLLATLAAVHAADKKIVFLAGPPSHGPGDHEHRAGCLLLSRCINQVPGVTSVVYSNGWPTEVTAFEGADAVIIYSDGGGGHPAIRPERLQVLNELMNRGVGLGLLHYAVEVPKDRGGAEFLKWAGGYFETYWSVNPFWTAEFKTLPDHPITRGVQPFSIRDEWYYHMRFPEGMRGVTPILTAVPPDSTRGRPGMNDPHGGNPEVQKHRGEPEHVMWAIERPDGGRGFGFTGGHSQSNWGNPNFRKIVLNAILWSAKGEVPAQGVDCPVTEEDLKQNLDRK
jgi:type 1 glutamine amidotransferase